MPVVHVGDGSIPVLLCVDVEPDSFVPQPSDSLAWNGFPAIHVDFTRLRDRLAAVTGTHPRFSWFLRLDAQVEFAFGEPDWIVSRDGDLIESLAREGDEIGLHVHAVRRSATVEKYQVGYADPAQVEQCIRDAAAIFQSRFARPARAFRLGFGWMDTRIAAVLESIGVRYDLSIEWGRQIALYARPGEILVPGVVDHTQVPRMPYRPSKSNYRVPDPTGVDGLWCVPVSTGTAPFFSEWRENLHRPLRWRRALEPADLCRPPRVVRHIIDQWLSHTPRPYLTLVVRSSTAAGRFRDSFERNLDLLCRHPLARRFRYVTPEDAISALFVADRRVAGTT
jgi:hypothetical protein